MFLNKTSILLKGVVKMTLENAIALLMKNDHNATWEECKTLEELKEGLSEALKGYEETEENYVFYKSILEQITI